MIGISKLYCGAVEPGDVLRYHRESKKLPSHLLQFSADKRPVIVWNMTRRCNLRCIHCKVSPENNEGSYDAIEMPIEVFEKLVPMLRTYRPRVQLSG
ncbi:MAG TPA: hypothetical protein VIK19_02300, partial [Syntrophales bacterium]